MCGIVGIFQPQGLGAGCLSALTQMRDRLYHRGPDAAGSWADEDAGIALGHRRLSILELSDAGAQPMVSASGRFVITFNGEIYNFRELRESLEQQGSTPTWRGSSDTETLLAAIDAWGIEATLKRVRGMFAFGSWDRHLRKLYLARDPMGEKPLYIADLGTSLIFGSELKALTVHPAWKSEIDRQAVALCLRHGYIPAPKTIFSCASKVMPGELIELSREKMPLKSCKRTLYWDLQSEAKLARENRFEGNCIEAADRLDSLLHTSVRRQMISDVPLGAFLSGGIDSSTITAIMQNISSKPVQSFALGFHEKRVNEAEFAKAIANHLGTDHHEIYLSGHDARDLVLKMPDVYDEPFADESQLPTYLLSQFVKSKVTVSLSGDAGDELFGGYGRYHSFCRKWNPGLAAKMRRLGQLAYSRFVLNCLVGPLRACGVSSVGTNNLLVATMRWNQRISKLRSNSAISSYEAGFTHMERPDAFVPGAPNQKDRLVDEISEYGGWSVLDQISFLDSMRYLPDDILVKVDRAAMAHSLESRIPLLDPDIVRFALSLPDEIKLQNGEGKGVLKAVLSRYVPRDLWDRPKRGFGIPCTEWLMGPLKELASDLLSPSMICRTGVLDKSLVDIYWQQFLQGKGRHPNFVWTLFVTQLYLDRCLSASSRHER